METGQARSPQPEQEKPAERSRGTQTQVAEHMPSVEPARLPVWSQALGDGPAPALAPPPALSRLAVGRPDDPEEGMADLAAEQSLHPAAGIERGGSAHGGPEAMVQEGSVGDVVQRSPVPAAGPGGASAPGIVGEVLSSPGAPLPPGSRAFVESRFGASFAGVRVHTDARASESARAVGALAYTVGSHIVFRAGQYAPGVPTGDRLLAHELAHTLQQAQTGRLVVNRQDEEEPGRAAREPTGTGVTVEQPFPTVRVERRTSGGSARVLVQGIEWARIEWDPARGNEVEILPATGSLEEGGFTSGVAFGLRIRAAFPVTVHVDTAVEDLRGTTPTLFSYDFQTPGTIHIGGQELTGPIRIRHYHVPPPSLEERRITVAPNPDLLDPFGPFSARDLAREEEARRERVRRFVAGHPSFDTWQELEAYIRQHGNESFVGMMTPDGRFVARRVTEADLQRLANTVREGTVEIEEAPLAGEQPRLFTITGLYIRGRTIPVHELDTLREQYYDDEFSAFMGHGDTVGAEAEIYCMGDFSYGRRLLSHDQALARWRELDAYNAETIRGVQTLPGRRFVALWVSTPRRMVEIGELYFRGRDSFYRNADLINQLASSQFGADLLVGRRLATPAHALAEFYGQRQDIAVEVMRFLEAEVYREVEDPRFRDALTARRPLSAAVAASVYDEAENRARVIVMEAINSSIEGLRPLVDDREQLREFVRMMPSMSEERRRQMVQSIGVPERDQSHVVAVLGDPRRAANIVYGQTETESTTYVGEPVHEDRPGGGSRVVTPRYTVTTYISLDRLHEWASDHLEGLQEFWEKVRDRDIDPLSTGGDFGNEVRQRVYAEMGFTELHPEDFPHDNATTEFMPDPLAPTTLRLPTMAEQLFANHAARNEDVEFIQLVGKITAMVIATVALTIVTGGLGAYVATYFGLTGLIGAAVEVGVAALSFTLISTLASSIISGELPSGEEFLKDLGLNIAMFGIFRALQPVFVAASEALVASRGVGAAIRGTVGARAGLVGVQTGLEMSAFLAFGIGHFVVQHNRLPRTGREWFIVAYESALTAILMRAGSMMARPTLERALVDARSRRLGDLEPAFNEFRGDALRFERDFQSTIAARPHRLAAEGTNLATRAAELLARQRSLASQLRERLRTRGDAEAVRELGEQIQAIEAVLQGLNSIGGFGALGVRPVGETGSVFTYRPGERALELLRRLYGENNVTVDAEGRVRVSVPGAAGVDLTYLPEALSGEAETLAGQQLSLTQRMQRLSERADLFGVEPAELEAVRGSTPAGGGRRTGGIRPGARRTPEAIREAEELVTTAETAVEAEIRRLAQTAYRQFRTVPARRQALADAREGELSSLTDEQVGEAIHLFAYRSQRGSRGAIERVRTVFRLGTRELRGILFAYREGLNLAQLRGRVRNFSESQRNFILDTYARMMEARIDGATRVLSEMLASDNKFEGGTYAMEFARNQVGLERIARMERPELNPDRIVDIILTDGTRVELKAWRRWQHGSLEWQFEKDVLEVCGSGFSRPADIQRLQYVFRPPIPRDVPQVRGLLRARLQNMLERSNASTATRQEMLSQFDLHTGLVSEGVITRAGGRAPEPVQVPEPPPPPPGRRRDDEEEEEDSATPTPIQRKPLPGAGSIAPGVGSRLVRRALRGPGRPLEAGVWAYMEGRFGRDFTGVQVHASFEAAQAARAVRARAFTAGRQIVFGAGEYAPGGDAGRRLLAHELAHVVQQSAAQRPPPGLVSSDVEGEQAAERAEHNAGP